MPTGRYFTISEDNRHAFVGLAVWNLDRLEMLGYFIDHWRTTMYTGTRIAISPNETHVVIGAQMIRVWNLTLSDEPNMPIARFNGPDYRIRTIRFVDNATVEAISWAGEVTYWNIETGEQVMR
jgi:hypothetical protein